MKEAKVQHSITSDAEHSVAQPGLASSIEVKLWSSRQRSIVCYIIASLCFVSELIHLWLLPEQYEVFSGYGIIFLLIAMAQGFIGISFLFEPRRRIMTFGLWINVLVVFLYIFTHTIGVLVGKRSCPYQLILLV